MSKPPRTKTTTADETETKEGQAAHQFQRVDGPGPNDAGKGAAGREALDRLAGAPEVVPDGRAADESEDDED